MNQEVILASASPRRRELLRSLGVPYEIIVSEVDEQISADQSPSEIVKTLSQRKAKSVYKKIKDVRSEGVIIGADTVVVFGGQILGKPRDPHDAFRMLQMLQGNTHEVYSGIACIHKDTGKQIVKHCKTSVTMKPLSDQQINRYIATGEPTDKAGAYAIQGLGATFVENIEGDYFSVVGLSLSLVSEMLNEFHINVI